MKSPRTPVALLLFPFHVGGNQTQETHLSLLLLRGGSRLELGFCGSRVHVPLAAHHTAADRLIPGKQMGPDVKTA